MTQIHSARLVTLTPDAEKNIAYMARVSSKKQENEKIAGLLRYCMTHGHWSIFEMAHMSVEIITTRAIETQILRHRSFSFQSFSQRYSDPSDKSHSLPSLRESVRNLDFRLQDTKNRQNSIETDQDFSSIESRCLMLIHLTQALYDDMIMAGIAKECARNLLPACQPTKMYMTGSIRSWIHYLNVRCKPDSQKEHRMVADSIKAILADELPIIFEAAFS